MHQLNQSSNDSAAFDPRFRKICCVARPSCIGDVQKQTRVAAAVTQDQHIELQTLVSTDLG
jgi:hypothetical protein